jgi:MFS family permease
LQTRTSSAPPWLKTGVLTLCGLIVALQQTLVVPLLPVMPDILGVSTDDASWLVTATLLMGAVATPIISRMADMYGKRKMLVLSLAIMTLGSLVAALGGGFIPLVIGRALQGVGAALIPVGISIMRDELPREKVAGGIALMSATIGIGAAMGLPLAGVLYEAFGWPSLFWSTALVGTLLMVAIQLLVDESRVRLPGRFDVAGAIVLSVSLASFLLAISKGASWGWGSGEVIGLLVLAAVSMAIWIPLQLKVAHPMVDLMTSTRPPVLLTNIATFFVGFAMFINGLVTAQELQLPAATGFGQELDTTTAGLAMVPGGLMMLVFAPVSSRLLRRFGGKPTLLIGIGVMAASYVWRVYNADSVLHIVLGNTFVGIGTAISYAALPMLIMAAVPISETASANGVNALVRAMGTAVGSAIVALVFASLTLEVAGHQYPSSGAVDLTHWLGAGTCLAALAIGLFLPRTVGPALAGAAAGAAAPETIARGTLALGAGRQQRPPAIVTVLHLDGAPVDWSRVDQDGAFSVVLPGPGRYVFIANAQGWSPRAQILEITGETADLHLELTGEQTLSGTVARDGQPAGAAIVSLNKATGEHIRSTIADAQGRYALPLPAAGPYLITAIDPQGGSARSRKVVLALQSATMDLELPAREPERQQATP